MSKIKSHKQERRNKKTTRTHRSPRIYQGTPGGMPPTVIIVELENWTGDEFSKKSLPESLIKEMQMDGIPQKKQSRTK